MLGGECHATATSTLPSNPADASGVESAQKGEVRRLMTKIRTRSRQLKTVVLDSRFSKYTEGVLGEKVFRIVLRTSYPAAFLRSCHCQPVPPRPRGCSTRIHGCRCRRRRRKSTWRPVRGHCQGDWFWKLEYLSTRELTVAARGSATATCFHLQSWRTGSRHCRWQKHKFLEPIPSK